MSLMSLKVTGLNEMARYLKKTKKRSSGAVGYANKKVGFKYRKKMASEIARGKPGAVELSPLSKVIVFRRRIKAIKGRKALSSFGRFIRHRVYGRDLRILEIGLLESGPYATAKGQVRNFKKLVSGYKTRVTKMVRKFFEKYGHPKTRRSKSYVLKKETKVLFSPERPAIEHFRRRYQRQLGADFDRVVIARIKGESVYL